MLHAPFLLPVCHSLRTQPGNTRALTSPARFLMTPLIGRLRRSHTAIAGNQSSGDTSMDCLFTCSAKHFALVIHHDSPAAFASETIRASSGLSAFWLSPVELSVTSCRNFLRRYVSVSVMFSTYGSHHVVSSASRCLADTGRAWRRRSSSIWRSSFCPCQFSYFTSARPELRMPKREPMKPQAHHPMPSSLKTRRLDSRKRSESACAVWLAQPNSPTIHHTPFVTGSSHRFMLMSWMRFMPSSANLPDGVAPSRAGIGSAASHPAKRRRQATVFIAFMSMPNSTRAVHPSAPLATRTRGIAQSPSTTCTDSSPAGFASVNVTGDSGVPRHGPLPR